MPSRRKVGEKAKAEAGSFYHTVQSSWTFSRREQEPIKGFNRGDSPGFLL